MSLFKRSEKPLGKQLVKGFQCKKLVIKQRPVSAKYCKVPASSRSNRASVGCSFIDQREVKEMGTSTSNLNQTCDERVSTPVEVTDRTRSQETIREDKQRKVIVVKKPNNLTTQEDKFCSSSQIIKQYQNIGKTINKAPRKKSQISILKLPLRSNPPSYYTRKRTGLSLTQNYYHSSSHRNPRLMNFNKVIKRELSSAVKSKPKIFDTADILNVTNGKIKL